LKFEVEFHNNIKQLLTNFPVDSKTQDGALFWSGPKRAPTPLTFDAEDQTHLNFIIAAANLRAYNFGLKGTRDPAMFKEVLRTVTVPKWSAGSNIKIATTDEEAKAMASSHSDDHDQQVNDIIKVLPTPPSLAGYQLRGVEFEKDDDTNFHMALITAVANLRARNYKIKEVSQHQAKFIAGKIIPAIATTTALVTGLVCLEQYKVIQKLPVEAYRNTYVNLAISLFAMSEPFPPTYTTITLKNKGEWKWSLWDMMDVDTNDGTLQEFLDYFQEKFGLEVNMLSYGSSMLYYDFGMGLKKKIKARLSQPLTKVVQKVSGVTLDPSERYLVLGANVNDEDMEDVEIPSVRYKFR